MWNFLQLKWKEQKTQNILTPTCNAIFKVNFALLRYKLKLF